MNPSDVKIELRSRDEPLPENVRTYALEKASRLTRFHDRISSIQIVAEQVRQTPSLEIIVHVDNGATLVAREQSASLRGAIDVLMSKIERQLKKDKEKLKDHKGDGARGPEVPPTTGGDEESYDDVVRRDLGGS